MYENYFSEYTNLNFNEYIEVQTAYLWNVYTSSLGTWESQVHSFLALVSLIKKKKKRANFNTKGRNQYFSSNIHCTRFISFKSYNYAIKLILTAFHRLGNLGLE